MSGKGAGNPPWHVHTWEKMRRKFYAATRTGGVLRSAEHCETCPKRRNIF